METRRVVVTGMGTINPLGKRIDEFWKNIKNGVNGVGQLTRFDCTEFATKIAAELRDFNPTEVLDKKEVRSAADFTVYALYSSVEAMEMAGLAEGGYDPDRTGVYVGNGIGGFEVVEDNMEKLFSRGPRAVAPLTIPKLITNEAAGNISIKYGIHGPSVTVATACASGTDAIGAAFQAVKYGIVDKAVACGTEGAITKLAVSGFNRIQALSTNNDNPETACRPFDATRDGFILGEGAGTLILETLEDALARGAKIYGEILGYGMTNDAYHLTAPDPAGTGAAKAMQKAIAEAGLKPEDIDYVNAHGTSTQANDVMETNAIKIVFGEHAYKLKVSSTKSMTGHLVGAAGAVESIISLMALQDQFYPPTINYSTPDENCDLDYVPNKGVEAPMRYALSESLGFGGHNGALVFAPYKG